MSQGGGEGEGEEGIEEKCNNLVFRFIGLHFLAKESPADYGRSMNYKLQRRGGGGEEETASLGGETNAFRVLLQNYVISIQIKLFTFNEIIRFNLPPLNLEETEVGSLFRLQ